MTCRPNIVMHGWIDNRHIDSWYRSADAVIVPSRWEGLPFVIVEALRNGTPVLVSDRSGMPDLVEPGKTGEVFALDSDAIARLLGSLDREALHTMRPLCRRSYEERFTIDRYKAEFLSLLDSVSEVPGESTVGRRCA